MTDFFLIAAPPEPSRDELLKPLGYMLGSIDWDQTAQLGEILTGQLWTSADLEWAEPEGETQMGRVPDRFAQALAAILDEQLLDFAEAWRVRLGAGFFQDSLARDIDGLRSEAQKALKLNGALWLRIEL